MKNLWYVKNNNGSVINISTEKAGAENFLTNQLQYQGAIFYVQVPEEDWNSLKVNVSTIDRYAKNLYQ